MTEDEKNNTHASVLTPLVASAVVYVVCRYLVGSTSVEAWFSGLAMFIYADFIIFLDERIEKSNKNRR